MPCEVVVQTAGDAYVLRIEDIWEDGRRGGDLPPLLCRYGHVLLLQATHTSACNKLHTITQRAARWILTMHDRVGRDDFRLTQESLAVALGTRRQSINAVARALQRAGGITYRHGIMRIRNRAKVESASCECYRLVRRQFATLHGAHELDPPAVGRRKRKAVCPCCGVHPP